MTPFTLAAQWAPHPNAAIPRNADGAPNLEAPAPRTADGKPDLTGVWQGFGTLGGSAAQAEPESAVPRAGFANVGQNMKEPLPLRPEVRGAGGTAARRRRQGQSRSDCLPMGIMQFHTQGAPRKFIQTPDVLVILYEASMGIRQIFTDGREFPTNDPQPWWYGYSVGHWEGDTLVVVTKGLRGDGWLDIFGTPLTDAAMYTERFRRVSYGRMEIDVTVDDPKAYTAPWTVRVNQRIMPEQELLEFVCNENNRYFVRARNRRSAMRDINRYARFAFVALACGAAAACEPAEDLPAARVEPAAQPERPACRARPAARRSKRLAGPLRVPTDRARLRRAADSVRRAPRRRGVESRDRLHREERALDARRHGPGRAAVSWRTCRRREPRRAARSTCRSATAARCRTRTTPRSTRFAPTAR